VILLQICFLTSIHTGRTHETGENRDHCRTQDGRAGNNKILSSDQGQPVVIPYGPHQDKM